MFFLVHISFTSISVITTIKENALILKLIFVSIDAITDKVIKQIEFDNNNGLVSNVIARKDSKDGRIQVGIDICQPMR